MAVGTYKRTPVLVFPKPGPPTTDDSKYWSKLEFPITIKEFGAIDYVDVSPIEPHYFAVSCSAKVQVYNPLTNQVAKNLNKFQLAAFGGSFRSDGQLICAGGDENKVKMFDVSTQGLLRVFRGHTRAVHRCRFTPDKKQIVSFSDDKTAALWDIAGECIISSFEEHTDYLRAGVCHPNSSSLFASGSYDKTVKIWDHRSGTSSVATMNHEFQVESLLWHPSGGLLLTAGGTEVRIWDILAGGRLLAKLCSHHKAVTCLSLVSQGTKLMSGSLDRHVKVYDMASYTVVHSIDYPSPILSLGVTPDDSCVVVGMTDGLLSIRHRKKAVDPEVKEEKTRRTWNKWRHRAVKEFSNTNVDAVVPEYAKGKRFEARYDKYLRQFEFTKTLDYVIKGHYVNKKPQETVAVMQALIRHGGLHSAVSAREGKTLGMLFNFLCRFLGDPRFTRTLLDVSNIVLDCYEGSVESSREVQNHCRRLREKVKALENHIKELMSLGGAIEFILEGRARTETDTNTSTRMQPSTAAAQTFVVELT